MQIRVAELFRYLLQISGIPARFIKSKQEFENALKQLDDARKGQQQAEMNELNSRAEMNRAKAANLALQYSQQ
jgi:hypothetical protein